MSVFSRGFAKYPVVVTTLLDSALTGCQLNGCFNDGNHITAVSGIAHQFTSFPDQVLLRQTELFAERMADSRKGAVLATLFFFINGGLGFFYLFDTQYP